MVSILGKSKGCNNWRVVDLITTNVDTEDKKGVPNDITWNRGKNE